MQQAKIVPTFSVLCRRPLRWLHVRVVCVTKTWTTVTPLAAQVNGQWQCATGYLGTAVADCLASGPEIAAAVVGGGR